MTTRNDVTKVNVYLEPDGNWYFAAWCGGDFDTSGLIESAESAESAIAWAESQWPLAKINEVESTSN